MIRPPTALHIQAPEKGLPEITIIPTPLPAGISVVNLSFRPRGHAVEKSLKAAVPKATWETGIGVWGVGWTRSGHDTLLKWLKALHGAGYAPRSVNPVMVELERLPVHESTPMAIPSPIGWGPMPAHRLIRMDNLRDLSEEDWRALRENVPGMAIPNAEGALKPIKEGTRPDSAWTSAIHYKVVSEFFPNFGPLVPQVKAANGFDAPILPASAFPVAPVFDKLTGKQLLPDTYQIEGASRLVALKSGGVSLGTGAGKTLLALMWADYILRHRLVDRIVICSPRALQRTDWGKELAKWYHKKAIVVNGPKAQRARAYEFILSHPNFHYVITRPDQWESPVLRPGSPEGVVGGFDIRWLQRILGPRTGIIFDEAHLLKNSSTIRFRSVVPLLNRTGTIYRVFASGTYWGDRPWDAFGPAMATGWRPWNNRAEFMERYLKGEEGEPIPTEVPKLQAIMDTFVFRKNPNELGLPQLNPLPPVYISPTPQEDWAYSIIRGELFKVIETAQNAGAKVAEVEAKSSTATRLEQRQIEKDAKAVKEVIRDAYERMEGTMSMERLFSCDPILVAQSPSPTGKFLTALIGRQNLETMSPGSKTRYILNWMADFAETQSGKAIIFVWSLGGILLVRDIVSHTERFRLAPEDAGAARSLRGKLAYFPATLMTDKMIEKVVHRFMEDPTCRFLISSDGGAVGQNFPIANHVVHYDLPLSYITLRQRRGRIIRKDQRNTCFAHTILMANEMALTDELQGKAQRFVDPRVRRLLDRKAEWQSMFK